MIRFLRKILGLDQAKNIDAQLAEISMTQRT